MKKILSLFTLIIASSAFSQIPTGYYNSAENLSGSQLQDALNNIIDGHTEFSYGAMWDVLKETDKDPANSDNVILIYSGKSINGPQEYNGGQGWNREHVWAKSRGDFGTASGPGTDAHALRSCDVSSNSSRANRSFDDCDNCTIVNDTWGDATGSFTNTSEYSFEPRDEVKGDVARMIFYMAVRYEGENGEPDLEPTELILPSNDQQPVHGVWSTLMEWHRNDPVSEVERVRNNKIYYDFQNNRNPFIDYENLAEHLWGTEVGNNWSRFLATEKEGFETLKIFPNPSDGIVELQGLKHRTQIEIYSIGGKMVYQTNNNLVTTLKLDLSHLKGVYTIKFSRKGKVGRKKLILN